MASFVTTGSDTGGTEYIYGAQLDDGTILYFDSRNSVEAAEAANTAAATATAAAEKAEQAAAEAGAVATALTDDEIIEICS